MELDLHEPTWINQKNNVEFKKECAKSYKHYEAIYVKTMLHIVYGY